jgi:hypothetical protein
LRTRGLRESRTFRVAAALAKTAAGVHVEERKRNAGSDGKRLQRSSMAFAIKAQVDDPQATRFAFTAQKTMYGGKHIGEGDVIFVFASENEGGHGLVARGVVTSAVAVPKMRGIARQTPRVSVTIRRTALAKRSLGRAELKPLTDWADSQPETELHFKF